MKSLQLSVFSKLVWICFIYLLTPLVTFCAETKPLNSSLSPLRLSAMRVSGKAPHAIPVTALPTTPLTASLAASLTTIEKTPLYLALGEQRALPFPPHARYSIGNSTFVKALPPDRLKQPQLFIKALKNGSTDLWIFQKSGVTEHRRILIDPWSPSQFSKELYRALSQLNETEIIYTGHLTGHLSSTASDGGGRASDRTFDQPSKKIVALLKGKIETLPELSKIQALARAHPNEIQDDTTLSDDLLSFGIQKLQSWLKQTQLDRSLRLEVGEGQSGLWLRGSLERKNELPLIEKKARSIFPGVLFDIQSLETLSPIVHFKVFLLELRKTSLKKLGLEWPSLQTGAFQIATHGIQEALKLDLTIHQLESQGSARVLSKPELVVRAPGEAELFAGGELPIQTHTQYNTQVTWKNFGLSLKLKVDQMAGNKIRLDIATEISHLDPALTSDSIPGLQANRMKTQVDAVFGRPLMLSGLLQDKIREEARGLPFLRNIPVLGALFGSEEFLKDRSELVVILLPTTSPPESVLLSRGQQLLK